MTNAVMVKTSNTDRTSVESRIVPVQTLLAKARIGPSEISLVTGVAPHHAEPLSAPHARSPQTTSDISPLELYLREVRQIPCLSRPEETTLAVRARSGDQAAREELIKANLRLVLKIAHDYRNFGLPLLDLISEGNIGLTKAVERFDPSRGAKFSVYASFWIKHQMRRAVADQARTVRLPVYVHARLFNIGHAAHRLRAILGREPTAEEIGGELHMKPSGVRRFRDASQSTVPLDEPQFDGEGRTLAECLTDPAAAAPDQTLNLAIELELLQELLARLTNREQQVLKLRFGLGEAPEKTLLQIGQDLGVTRERIRQIESGALEKLRKMIHRRDRASVAA